MTVVRIHSLKTVNIRIPLDHPKVFSTKKIFYRDYTLVTITTESGITGWAFVWGIPAVKTMIDMYRDLVIGELATDRIKIWNKIYSQADRWDRSGIIMRALSVIDIALWDSLGKYAGLPIHKLLGGCRDEIEVYYSGGYYPEDRSRKKDLLSSLEKELGQAKDRGFRAFKIKIGAVSPAVDNERIALARKTIGPDCRLMLDANCGYTAETIIPMAQEFAKYNITWLEEPVAVDDITNCAYVAERIPVPVALGENHFGKWQFAEILRQHAGRIIQADPTVMGGFTEYLNVTGLCSANGLMLAPHCFHDLSVQLGLARPEIMMLEYMDAAGDVINIQKILQNPVMAVNGKVKAPDGQGHGLILDQAAVKHYLYE